MLTPTGRSAFNVAEALEILSEDWAVLRYRGDYPQLLIRIVRVFRTAQRSVAARQVFTVDHVPGDMSSDRIDAESKVSGNQANIPARIRRELDIDDGDQLRWHLEDDGSIRVHVIQQQTGTFADFDGYAGEETTDVTSDHDAWGVDVE